MSVNLIADRGHWALDPVAPKQGSSNSRLCDCRRHGRRLPGIVVGKSRASLHTWTPFSRSFEKRKQSAWRIHKWNLPAFFNRATPGPFPARCGKNLGLSGSDDSAAELTSIWPVTNCSMRVRQGP